MLSEVLKIANKFIPNKESQIEFEKELIENNKEIIKSNKKLLEKVIPITFPICVWIIGLYALTNLVLGVYGIFYRDEILTIPYPVELSKLAFVFVCGLVGKWNIKEITNSKK